MDEGILPISIVNGDYFLLLGKETSSGLWYEFNCNKIDDNCITTLQTNHPVYSYHLVKMDYNNINYSYFSMKEKTEIKWMKLDEIKKIQTQKHFYNEIYPMVVNFILASDMNL
jgi:hypothetical protein